MKKTATTKSALNPAFLAAVRPQASTAGAAVRNSSSTTAAPGAEASSDKGAKAGNRFRTLYIPKKDAEALHLLAQSLYLNDMELNASLALRACLHGVNLKDPNLLDLVASDENDGENTRVNLNFYNEDQSLWKEIGVLLMRSGHKYITNGLIGKLIIRATKPDKTFIALAKDLDERRDKRSRPTTGGKGVA